jgi:hypothetical protein
MSVIVQLADAVAAELNAATFTPAFIAERRVLPVYNLSELTGLRVTVVPKAVEITGATRAASQHDLSVDIGVQQRVPPDSDVDAFVLELGGLVDAIADYLRRRQLTQPPGAGVSWVRTTNDPVYASEHLTEKRVFTSVLTVTYRGMK